MTIKSPAATLIASFAIPFFTIQGAVAQAPAEPGAAAAAQPDADAPQVLEQGPIHEAFAEPVALAPGAGAAVPQAPPEPINELPPEVRPEGNNVEWIPGYWMWSDQQQDYIWVSGVWREIPPGRRWVPGHWTQVEGGYTWTPGFWTGQEVHEVEMLPLPPDTLEAGPSSPAPGDNYFWIPGCWMYQNNGYVWRTGYWYPGQANWLWVPDHYCYTPAGAIFVSGYWDYPLAYRGLLYAPVWYPRPIYARAGYYYRPYSVLNTALLLTALFTNHHHHHYYYGYGGWRNDFYRPWWSHGYGRGGVYDPFFAYHRWHDGRNRDDWMDRVRRDFHRHQQDFAHHRGRPGDGRPDGRGQFDRGGSYAKLIRPINDVRRNNDLPIQLREVSRNELTEVQKRAQDLRELQKARSESFAKLAQQARSGQTGRDLANRIGQGEAGGPRLGGARSEGQRPGDNQLAAGDANRGRTTRTAFRLPPVERPNNNAGDAAAVARNLNRSGRAAGNADAQLRQQGGSGNAQARVQNRARVVVPGADNSAGADRPDFQALRRQGFDNTQAGQNRSGRTIPGADQGSGNAAARIGQPQRQQQQGRPQFRPGTVDPGDAARAAARQRAFNSQPNVTQGPSTFRNEGNQGQQQRTFRIPSQGGPSGAIQTPPGGAQRNIRVPSGGETRSFRVPSGGESARRAIQGGGPPNVRSIPQGGGNRPEMRGNFNRGGGGQQNIRSFQGGGGRPEMRGNFNRGGGGNANRGSGGGGGGRGRGRGRD